MMITTSATRDWSELTTPAKASGMIAIDMVITRPVTSSAALWARANAPYAMAEATGCSGELAGRLELSDALGDPVSAYSHGMRQKLVLTGALPHDPALLVLDEPFVGLDPSASHELKAILRERADAGGAVFFSSHVLEVVERLCDTVAVIRRGELVASGPTDEVRGSASLEDVFLELVDEKDAAIPSRR